MFSLTCAQKTPRVPLSASELKVWDRQRQERSERLQAARRAERKHTARFPSGYGPAGRVPAYVEAHVLSLRTSPLAIPVFSCGRGFPPSSRRPRSAPATPKPTCSRSAVAKRDGISTRPATACSATDNHPIVDPNAINRRPTTASGGCFTKQPWQQRQRRGSAASLLPSRLAEVSREGNGTSINSRVRPATAPCRGRATAKASSGRQRGRAGKDAGKAGVGQEEARLVQKLARLSGVQPGGDFPTVAALKTAVAIKALQVQLQGCRASSIPSRTLKITRDSRQDRAAWYAVSSSSQAAAAAAATEEEEEEEDEEADETLATPRATCTSATMRPQQRKLHRQRELEPWDDRAPHSRFDGMHRRNNKHASESLTTGTAASALRTLTDHDPLFGCPKASSPPCPRRNAGPHAAISPSPTREGLQSNRGLNVEAISAAEASAPAVVAAASAPQEIQMQACFRRLTVGTLIELNRLHTPPKPVQAVFKALSCLLGWKKLTALPPSTQEGRNCHHRRHRRQHRSQSRPHYYYPPRTLFSNAYALRHVLASIYPRRISNRRLSALTKTLGAEEAEPRKVRSANFAAAVLLEWIRAVVACARVADDAAS